jgi:hypothetical protein
MKAEDLLLLDVLALIKRYKPEDWNGALKNLRDGSFQKRFVFVMSLLSELAKTSSMEKRPISKAPGNIKAVKRPRTGIETLSNTQLRRLLTENSVPHTGKDSRPRLIKKAMTIKNVNLGARQAPSSGNYEDWVNIIMRRK